jgi:teichuronic acid biosynthesis glycosyltransferase TuaC
MESKNGLMMKVLFISSGNSLNGISSIIFNQGESLKKNGMILEYLTIKGSGLIGYLKSIPRIRKHIKQNKYDIVHAHYSLSAFAASLAGARPLIVSLMGSDVKSKKIYKIGIKVFNLFFWSTIIVKSEDMKNSLGLKSALVIPNGVDTDKFTPINRKEALDYTKWDENKRHVLFAANPNRYEKNYKLAQNAFELINDSNIELHSLINIKNEHMPFYINASDVVLLTSLWEGSPNVIKESMACNSPIVSTDVGDVKYMIKKIDGCYVTSFNKEDIKKKIILALEFSETQGINRIKQLELDSNSIAKKLIAHYLNVKKNNG